jgi:hypothetical protein
MNGKDLLGLEWETEYNRGSWIGNKMDSWFKAPETTRVRFYMSCDDDCKFDISKTADTKIDTTVTDYTPLMTGSVKGYRNYFDADPAAAAAPAAPATPAAADQNVAGYLTSDLDKAMLAVHNDIRMNPGTFVAKLEAMLPRFSDPSNPNYYIVAG